jgi:hypothetical protein
MERIFVAIATIGVLCSQGSPAQTSNLVSPSASANPSVDAPKMPPAPRGPSTIFGGNIQALDPVRDQLTLNVYGERPMKILFDERTEVYRDGKRIPLRELSPTGHASVETTLDGAKLFALSIHVISKVAPGDYEGRVVSYNQGTGELSLVSDLSPEPLKVLVQPHAQFSREGQSGFAEGGSSSADLVRGTLVSVQFDSAAKNGDASASEVRILAVPGSAFAFRGKISSLDERAGRLVLVDPRDNKTYAIYFSAAGLPPAQVLHLDDEVRVVANYDGVHYVASNIEVSKPEH